MNKKTKMIVVILFIVLGLAFIFFSLYPRFSNFRNSIYGLVMNDALVLGIILYCSLSKKIHMPLAGKITIWIFGVLYILFSIISIGKIGALFFFIYSLINVSVTILIYKKTQTLYTSIWMFGALSYLSTVIFVLRAEYIHGDMNSTFIYSSIIVAILIFLPCLIYGLKEFKKDKSYEKLIGTPLLGLLGGFVFTFLTLASMNIYLDTSKPTYEEYIIKDKEINTGAKKITTYEFKVQKDDNSFRIAVSEMTYYRYEINDSIVLSIYSGAFNEPYIIYDQK